MPIQLVMYSDRMEIINPGGLYGRLTVDQLGQAQNRYSGVPTIRCAMKNQSLPKPDTPRSPKQHVTADR